MGLDLNETLGATILRSGLRSGVVASGAIIRRKRLAPLAMLALAGVVMSFAGCEDSARPPVAYHPPNISPSTASAPASRSTASAASSPAPFSTSGATKPLTKSGDLPVNAALSLALNAQQNPLVITSAAGRVPALGAVAPHGIAILTDQVESVYQTGQQDLNANRVARALQRFTEAQSLLIESDFDVQSDPRLATLYSRIMDGIIRSDQVASAQGLDLSADAQTTPAPPAPLDVITSLTPPPEEGAGPVDPSLRTSAEGELQQVPHDLPMTVNDIVLSYLNFFQTTHGRAIVETGLRRAGRYRPMIEQALREEGLPSDLMYMAQAESAFQPQALSKAGARGLWQFMSFRGKQYGLDHSYWIDDRQDPEKATHAAAHHLRDLYEMFGDWYLVMAAYNSGPGTVQHAVERTGYADFWELYRLNVLPKETRNYVPIILALTMIAKDPARYGIDVQPEPALQTDKVKPGHALDLRLVSDVLDVDVDTLRELNPELLRLTTPAEPGFVLRLPVGTAERFSTDMAAIPPEKWLTWRQHRVEEGDTLASVAQRFRVTAASLVEANGLNDGTSGTPSIHAALDAGTKLIIPLGAESQPTVGKLVRYRTRKSDSLESVADEFDVSVAELKKWNHLRADKVVAGMRLKIYPGGMTPPTETKTTETKTSARDAESASGRASVTRVSDTKVPAIRVSTTRVSTPRLTASRTDVAGAITAERSGTAARGGQPVVHTVHRGETLYSIARAYMTTVEALRTDNHFLASRSLQTGDTLTISR